MNHEHTQPTELQSHEFGSSQTVDFGRATTLVTPNPESRRPALFAVSTKTGVNPARCRMCRNRSPRPTK